MSSSITKAAENFTVFSNLPSELRRQVWILALRKPRAYSVALDDMGRINVQKPHQHSGSISISITLSRVCKESRAYVLSQLPDAVPLSDGRILRCNIKEDLFIINYLDWTDSEVELCAFEPPDEMIYWKRDHGDEPPPWTWLDKIENIGIGVNIHPARRSTSTPDWFTETRRFGPGGLRIDFLNYTNLPRILATYKGLRQFYFISLPDSVTPKFEYTEGHEEEKDEAVELADSRKRYGQSTVNDLLYDLDNEDHRYWADSKVVEWVENQTDKTTPWMKHLLEITAYRNYFASLFKQLDDKQCELKPFECQHLLQVKVEMAICVTGFNSSSAK